MPCEPLCEEKIPRRPVYVGDSSVPQRVKRIEPIEPGDELPCTEEYLDAVLSDPVSALLNVREIIRLTSTSVGGR